MENCVGWREASGNLYSFLLAPLARCAPEFFTWGWSYFTYRTSLQSYIVTTIRNARAFLDGSQDVVLSLQDWLTGWILHTYLMTPSTQALDTHIATGLTVTADDLNLSHSDIVNPFIQTTNHGMWTTVSSSS